MEEAVAVRSIVFLIIPDVLAAPFLVPFVIGAWNTCSYMTNLVNILKMAVQLLSNSSQWWKLILMANFICIYLLLDLYLIITKKASISLLISRY